MDYIRLWLMLRPIRTAKRLLNKRRARKGKTLFNVEDNEELIMNEQVASAIRTVLKVAAGALVTWGYLSGDMVEPIIGLALAAYGVYASYKAHKAEV